ncbi:MAG: ligase [Thermoflavifilum sp.]|nr:ligase [Thermoflavifilum sp.]MCL6512967.1 ligase [Alicyclobacillus sp.]
MVGAGTCPPLIRLWRAAHAPGIGVSRKDVAHPAGEAARRQLMEEGLSVVVRDTGGTAVPQGDGVLHVSYIFPRPRARATTDTFYRLLCGPMVDWLQTLGLMAGTGALPGSYCDGTYNVLVSGRKLVGTAQAWRGGLAGLSSRHPGYVLVHACITVTADMATMSGWINRFYMLSGQSYRVDPALAVTLDELSAGPWRGTDAAEAARMAGERYAEHLTAWLTSQGVRVVRA